jgi:protein-S-isoprenylcysteine O-methyltransferase Ste14
MDSPEGTGVAVVEPASQGEQIARPRASVRTPSGAISRFDEIVTPHPVIGFLFRRRTFIVLIGVLAVMAWARPRWDMLAAGIVLTAAAECWRIWAAGTIHKTEELTTGGPYAYARHPLYVGSFLHAVAYALMSGRWESFLIILPLFCLVYGAAVTIEEQMLFKLFGEQYEAYCRRVPRFLPRLRALPGGHGQFSWDQVRANKEYVNVVWVCVISALFVLQLVAGR